MSRRLRLALTVAACVAIGVTDSRADLLFSPIADGSPHARILRFDRDRLIAQLRLAPPAGAGFDRGVLVSLPMPDGSFARFRIVESPIFSAEAAARFPEIRTYRARGVDEPSWFAALDLSHLGLHGLIFTSRGAVLLDPVRPDEVSVSDLDAASSSVLECEVNALREAIAPAMPTTLASGDTLRTFRYILMAVGEYTQGHGSVANAEAVLAGLANLMVAMLERDATVRLEVVQIHPFENGATDPYDEPAIMGYCIDRNTVVVDSLYGSASYDVAQVVTVIGGTTTRGLGYAPCVCADGYKAGGVIGAWGPAALNLFLTMGHEMGHQLGFATHTQDRANCNRFPSTAWEVSAGVTVVSSMGAACPADFQPVRDPFYHAGNVAQLHAHFPTIPDCGTRTATGNAVPTADAGLDRTIPRGTPYVLSGVGTDADAGDVLTYTWEQMDAAPTSADSVLGPLVRYRPPTTSPVRTIPLASTVLSGVYDPWERLANADRLLHFRFFVRDNRAGAGGVAWDDVTLTVSGAPFAVSSPNGGETVGGGGTIPVTWTVGGGTTASTVNILLSTDSGATWTTLAPATANDGAETVNHTETTTQPDCRIKVEAADNIFYDVSNADFTVEATIVSAPLPGGALAALGPIRPNPMTEGATIGFTLSRPAGVDLSVIDATGRQIRALAEGSRPAGPQSVTWDGADDGGRTVAPGVYFVRLVAGGEIRVQRLTRLSH